MGAPKPKQGRMPALMVSVTFGVGRNELVLLACTVICSLLMACTGFMNGPARETAIPPEDLFKEADAFPLVDPSVLVIPKSAFDRAVAGPHLFRADEVTKQKALELSSRANELGTLGIRAEVFRQEGTEQHFEGSLFLVVEDPVMTTDGVLVQSRKYFVAAAEIVGTSPWLGKAPQFATRSVAAGISGRCCGPLHICVPEIHPPGPGPCNPAGGAYCPGLNERGTVGVTPIVPENLERRAEAGLPLVDLYLLENGASGGLVPSIQTCIRVLDKQCLVAKPICNPGDPGYTTTPDGSADLGSGSCDGTEGRQVPKICTLIAYWEELPAECGGSCPSCGLPPGAALDTDPMCVAAEPTENSSLCRSKEVTNLSDNLAMMLLAGGPNGKHCEPTKRGGEICTICNDGKCHQTVDQPAIDPTIADKDPDEGCFVAGGDLGWPVVFRICDEGSGGDGGGTGPGTPAGDPKPNPSHDNPNPGPPADTPPPPPVSGEVPGPKEESKKDRQEKKDRTPTFLTRLFEEPSLTDDVPAKRGDPVDLAYGAFVIHQADLSFRGPVRSLEFIRKYSSRSRTRTLLGSNWSHSWDVWLQPLSVDTAPVAVLPYCAGASSTATCLVLHDGSGSTQLFFFDVQSRLFLPEAGSTDTIARTTEGGWALRKADGHILTFDKHGYLVNDRDRFGNGFSIEYEPTPLYELYTYFCSDNRYSRRCAVLTYLLNEGSKPSGDHESWQLKEADYEVPPGLGLGERLRYARAYLLYLISLGPSTYSVDGGRHFRPIRITDDVRRKLELRYRKATNLDFEAAPGAELLWEVLGPAGTRLTYTYERPQGYPKSLNEYFLTRVTREDTPQGLDVVPAPRRTIEYRYQWPSGPAQSYDNEYFTAMVLDKYRGFYETFVNCLAPALGGANCKGGHPVKVPGNPKQLAEEEKKGYISEVADNIIEVVTNGRVESETRYDADPKSPNFDRVAEQRYGSAVATQSPGTLPPEIRNYKWKTNLPRAIYSYQSAGPKMRGTVEDRTDSTGFLPDEIKKRYPLESGAKPRDPLPLVTEDRAVGIKACNYDLMELRKAELPGYVPTVQYYVPVSEETQPKLERPLYRTHLTCGQLAEAHLSDPAHNDVLSSVHPITETPLTTDHFAVRIVGHRRTIAANMNRICTWTRFVDRDGDVHYYGLNYRGQILVEAIKERTSGQFIFSEKLYSADGAIFQERRPTRGPNAWTVDAGYTAYFYDEIEPQGNNGWNDWLPAFWARRMNLMRIEEHPAHHVVANEAENKPGTFRPSLGRYRRFGYEPLFNQLKFMEDGTLDVDEAGLTQFLDYMKQAGMDEESRHQIETGLRWPSATLVAHVAKTLGVHPSTIGNLLSPVDRPYERVDHVFDYQELAESDLKPILDHFKPWGFSWLEKETAPGAYEYDYSNILQWQLPVKFYGQDLNNDGAKGFGYGTGGAVARGVPVYTIRQATNGTLAPLIQTYIWAPHGMPGVIRGMDGAATVFEYYSIGSLSGPLTFGLNHAPTDDDVNVGYRSFLGRTRSLRVQQTYDAQYGPKETPCPHLAGPYQWLLPSTCTNVREELLALGLPPQMVNYIRPVNDLQSQDLWMTVAYSYSEIGEIKHVWTDNDRTSVLRDTDGRVLERTDPIGAKTTVTYDIDGRPIQEIVNDSDGILSEIARRFDEEGHLLYECVSLSVGGCAPLSSTPSLTGGVRGPSHSVIDGVVTQYEYWPEGSLRAVIDPEGLRTDFEYNERQLLTVRRAGGRLESFCHTDDGDPSVVVRGADQCNPLPKPASSLLIERYAYDGLRRVKTYTDSRQYDWQVAYSRRSQPVRYRQDQSAYGVSLPGKPAWERVLEYDELGRLIRQLDNGIVTEAHALTNRGWSFNSSATGQGSTYTTYDRLGRIVWMRDPAGTQTVSVRDPFSRTEAVATIRGDGKGTVRTTVSIQTFDVAGRLIEDVAYASGQEQVRTWKRNRVGFVEEATDPEGYLTKYTRNLLGWSRFVSKQRTEGAAPEFDTAEFSYNKRGQTTKIIDPNKQVTEIFYDSFGVEKRRIIPGKPIVLHEFAYDALGRLEFQTVGGQSIRFEYDERGDLVSEMAVNPKRPIVTRDYDSLGRVKHAKAFNPFLTGLPTSDRTVEESFDYDELGHLSKDTISAGSAPSYSVSSKWSLNPAGLWERELTYPLSTADKIRWRDSFDAAGRMAGKHKLSPGPLEIGFEWLGEQYIGRRQQLDGRVSPFREIRTLDAFGRPIKWSYSAIDLDENQHPLNTADGTAYCKGSWQTAQCGRPLLEIVSHRDAVGRSASLSTTLGFPVFNAGSLLPTTHPKPWQGYTYDPMGRLERYWDNPGKDGPVGTESLINGVVTDDQIASLGSQSTQWEYVREPLVGSTKAIKNITSGDEPWAIQGTRALGYQIRSVRIDGKLKNLSYDAAGHVASDNNRSFEYDPAGRLVTVRLNGRAVESYIYDPQGRLIAAINPGQSPVLFAYDGQQMVAAYDEHGDIRWEAVWGPGIDQLLEWEDHKNASGRQIALADHRNSITALYNAQAGEVRELANYNPEGRLVLGSAVGAILCREEASGKICRNADGIPFGFTSAWRSPTTGLLYMRNRWYSAELGQFLSHDSLGYHDSYNLYAYAGFDPINRGDAFGTQSDDWSKSWNAMSYEQRAKAAFHAQAPSRVLRGESLNIGPVPQFYSEQQAKLDEPPWFVKFSPFGTTVWKLMNLIHGETLGGLIIDRSEYAREVAREATKEIAVSAISWATGRIIGAAVRESTAVGRPAWAGRVHGLDLPAVQAGHRVSNWTRTPEVLAIEDADLNQLANWVGETGRKAYFVKPTIEVQGAIVDLQSALLWSGKEMAPMTGLSRNLVLEAPVHSGWAVPPQLAGRANAYFMERQLNVIAATPDHPLRFLLYKAPLPSDTALSIAGRMGAAGTFGNQAQENVGKYNFVGR